MKYRAYGIVLDSDVELPELLRADDADAPTMRLVLTPTNEPVPSPSEYFFGADGVYAARVEGGFLWNFFSECFFRVSESGAEVRLLSADRAVSAPILRHLVLDHLIPRTLNLRGDEVVHATSVLTPAGLCAFVAPSGVGKSTLAASFGAAGFPVLTDDCLILRAHERTYVGVPGYPGVRLLRDASHALFGEGVARSEIYVDYDKDRVELPLPFPDAPVPIAAVYLLSRLSADEPPRIGALSRREAFIGVVKDNTIRFNPRDKRALLRELEFYEAFVSAVPVRSCGVPEGLATLPAVRRAILDDLGLHHRDTNSCNSR